MTKSLAGFAILGTLILGACSDSNDSGGAERVEASSMDVMIESPAPNIADGTDTNLVTATVYIPEHAPGDRYPLVLHGHGWGGDRYSQSDVDANDPVAGVDLSNSPNIFTAIDRNVEALWNAGYAVISFDQRGFGRGDDGDDGTSDGAHVMDPMFEIVDVQAIIDWAAANEDLSLIMDGPGDPRVGAIGGSYGGAYQNLTAAVDDRLDALVPTATWFSLAQSLGPNNVIKKGYATGLCLLATTDGAQLASETEASCQEGAFNQTSKLQEDLSETSQQIFLTHGLNAYVEAGTPLPAHDVLLLQGNRDILFDLTQAIALYDAWSAAGGEVRFISHENGHSLTQTRNGPGSQGPLGPGTCGDIDVIDAMNAWLDHKLRGAALELPEICISLDDTSGALVETISRGEAAYTVELPETSILATQHNNSFSEADEAIFVGLTDPIVGDNLVLAGQPNGQFTVTDAGLEESVVFIGVGIERDGSRFLVDQQVTPLRSSDVRSGDATATIPLAGVGERLQDGDVVGLLVYGQFDQFENETRTNWNGNAANVSGQVALPIVEAVISQRVTPE